MPGGSANEPGGYTFEGMSPGSANEPPIVPAAVYKPTITSIVPNTCPVGGADITVKVTGTGFFAKSVCFVGGLVRATVFNGDGTLSVTFKPSTRTPGVVKVIVRNGVYPSNGVDFTFTATAEDQPGD
jgi:hypothetical protein